MSEIQLHDALNHCIDGLADGRLIDDCIQDYPDLAEELRPLLEVGQATGQNRANFHELQQMHSRLDVEIESLIENTDFKSPPPFRLPQGVTVLVASLLVVLIGLTVFLSDGRDNTGEHSTETATSEVTELFTVSPTGTASHTPTVIVTETSTGTVSHTPTVIVTETVTATARAIATVDITESPTTTVTGAPTITQMATATATRRAIPVEPTDDIDADICPIPSNWVAYRVKSGDSLSLIAVNSGTTVNTLREANCLDSSIIVEGETLYVPRLWDSDNSDDNPDTNSLSGDDDDDDDSDDDEDDDDDNDSDDDDDDDD